MNEPAENGRARRLSKEERRRQLLEVARRIVREEGADRLKLGYLAQCAGVSKPVAYDHFGDRSGLLVDLYRWIDRERVDAFRDRMVSRKPTAAEVVDELAAAYIECSADTTGEFYAVGAALAGREEKADAFEKLLEHSVQMYVALLAPHSELQPDELERRCIGLVGAGEALASSLLRQKCEKSDVITTFAKIIASAGGVRT